MFHYARHKRKQDRNRPAWISRLLYGAISESYVYPTCPLHGPELEHRNRQKSGLEKSAVFDYNDLYCSSRHAVILYLPTNHVHEQPQSFLPELGYHHRPRDDLLPADHILSWGGCILPPYRLRPNHLQPLFLSSQPNSLDANIPSRCSVELEKNDSLMLQVRF